MSRYQLAVIVAVAILLAPGWALAGQPCELEAVEGGIECLADDHMPHWEIEHPPLWGEDDNYLEQGEADVPVGPVAHGESAFYAVDRILFQLDPREGVVTDRTDFPGVISEIESDGEKLDITVEDYFHPDWWDDDPRSGDVATVTIPYIPGEPGPAQHLWAYRDVSAAPIAAMWEADWRQEAAADTEEAIEQLETARQADPTNPFFSTQLGELYQEQGDEELAHQAFEDAANTPNAVWHDLIHASSSLEIAGASDQADLAFERGIEKMEQRGVSRQRITALVPIILIVMDLMATDSPIVAAIETEDPQTVDRLASRLFELAPHIETGDYAWQTLANWMDDQGESELADNWRKRADENRDFTARMFTNIDRGMVALVALPVALFLLLVITGLRCGVARRREYDRSGEDDRLSLWMPRVRVSDLIVPGVLCVAALAVPYYLVSYSEVVSAVDEMPSTPAQDGLSAPHSTYWIGELAQSNARDRLLETAETELEAIERGEPIREKQLVIEDLFAAVVADVRRDQFELFKQGKVPDFTSASPAGDDGLFEPRGPDHYSLLGVIAGIPLLVVVFWFASILGVRFPKITRKILLVVPGGSEKLAPLGAAALVAVVAAVTALTGLDRITYELVMPGRLVYFGFDELTDYAPTPSRTWVWVTISAVVVYQAAMIAWQLRSSEPRQ